MSGPRRIRIATRGSELALAQARHMAARIGDALDARTELVVIRTSGDRIQDVPLAAIGGKGLFIKEIEEALLRGEADVAVHSAKDLPAAIAPGCALAAFPERADPRDALVSRDRSLRLGTLREGARVGTGSTRRRAQLLALRRDLEIVSLRGNVPTRIAKLEGEQLDAVVLAAAGLGRLGLEDVVCERIDARRLLPAPCQGTLALETREDDGLRAELAALEDAPVALASAAERAFLVELGGDCTVPLAAYATLEAGGALHLAGMLASADGCDCVREELRTALPEADGAARRAAAALGTRLARRVIGAGGRAILDALGHPAPGAHR